MRFSGQLDKNKGQPHFLSQVQESVTLPSGMHEGTYPVDKQIVKIGWIIHQFLVMHLSPQRIRERLVGLVQGLHPRTCDIRVPVKLVWMVALRQGLVGRLDHDLFSGGQQAKDSVVVFSQDDLPDYNGFLEVSREWAIHPTGVSERKGKEERASGR